MRSSRAGAFRDTTLEAARKVVGDYDGNRWLVSTFPESLDDRIRNDSFAFVSLDCDLYEPIRAGLDFFYPRLPCGGYIFVHDYSSGFWPGVRKAVDEFTAQAGITGVLLSDVSGSIVLTEAASARVD
jgi:hypothetical protein